MLLPHLEEPLPDVQPGQRVDHRQAGVGHDQRVTRRGDEDVVSGRAQRPGQRDHREDMPHTGGRNYENTHEDSPIENETFSILTVVPGVRERNGL
ncbi:hypothetical protein GCM10018954_015790 [Kutzneria kofuensis]